MGDLGEVAAGVRAGQQCEFRRGGVSDDLNLAGEFAVRIGIDGNLNGVADLGLANIRFLDVGIDPDHLRIMDQGQTLAGRDVFADFDKGLVDDTVDGAADRAVGMVQALFVQLRL